MTPESRILSAILREHGQNPRIRLFRRNVGLVTTPDGRRIRYGEPGQADLYGWIVGTGRHIEIEVKTKAGRLTKAQQRWRELCRSTGAVWILARSPEDVTEALSPLL